MEMGEVKKLVDTYHEAGRSREETVTLISGLPIDVEDAEVFEYIDLVYQKAPALDYHLTDMGNAKRFADQHRGKVLYSHEMKSWLIYIGGKWVKDRKGLIRDLAKRTALTWYMDVSNEFDDDRRKQLRQHAISSEREWRISAMLNLAQSEPGIPVTVEELDNRPWLFNCLNGTIDLHTGELLPHNPEDLLMQQSPVEYDPSATCPEWNTFLEIVTGSDQEIMTLLKRGIGVSLTADIRAQVLFFLYGTGCNGKSTFLAVLRRLFSSYGLKASMSLFTIKNKGESGPNESLANLQGKRYVMATETEQGKRLAVATIKDLTGGEPIRADRKYEHEIEFQPTFKLWLSGNHKPIITDTTYSIWRRIRLIPFTVKIDNPIEDYHLKLESELPGILNWAIDGCLEWQRKGPGQARAVVTATEEYRREQDVLGDFLANRCVFDPQATVGKGELYEAYQEWCRTNAGEELGKRKFGERLVEKGVASASGHGNKALWRGIHLLTDEERVNLVNQVEQFPESFPKRARVSESSGDLVNKVNLINHDNLDGDTLPPEYPTHPCRNCGCGEYWLTDDNRWLCSRCHPKPGSNGK